MDFIIIVLQTVKNYFSLWTKILNTLYQHEISISQLERLIVNINCIIKLIDYKNYTNMIVY